jgi:hypothetical protein
MTMPLAVHQNGHLTILPVFTLSPKQWGRHKIHDCSGACLVLQTIYALEAQTGITATKLVQQFNRPMRQYIPCEGISLASIVAELQPLLGNKTVRVIRHQTIQQAVNAMSDGGTVLSIFNADDQGLNPAHINNAGIAYEYMLRSLSGIRRSWGYYHSLMLVGYDAQERTVIFRESRPRYTGKFKGLSKVPVEPLINKKTAMAYIELVVQ